MRTTMKMLTVLRAAAGGGVTYDELVLATQPASLLSYLPLTEASGTAFTDASGNSRGASAGAGVTVGGTTFLDGSLAPLINSSFINWHSVSLRDAWNGAEHTLAGWAKHTDGSWGAAVERAIVSFFASGSAHYTRVRQHGSIANLLAGLNHTEIDAFCNHDAMIAQDWFHVAISVSKANNRTRIYVNGEMIQEASGIGTWSGSLAATTTCLGAVNISSGSPWGGGLRGWGAWILELTQAEIYAMYAVAPSQTRHILFVGDSKTAGDSWTRLLRESMTTRDGRDYSIKNMAFAISGATVATMKSSIDTNLAGIAAAPAPTSILINLGSNDMTTLPAEATWKANYVAMIDSLRAKWSGANIYLARPQRQSKEADADTIAGWIADIVALYPSKVLAGMDERPWLGDASYATYTTDGTHYSAAGQIKAAAEWLAVV